MTRFRYWFLVFPTLALCSAPSLAQQCAAHYKFDGNLADSSGGGGAAFMANAAKAASSLQFTNGNYGQALILDGNTVLRLPVDISFETCPQFTISAWIQVPQPLPKNTMFVFGTGSGGSPGLSISGANLVARGSANGIIQQDAVLGGPEWIFVAVVYDSINETYRLHWRHREKSKELANTGSAAESIWLGAVHQASTTAATGIIVDDLRIYPQALTIENVADIRMGKAPTPGTSTGFASSAGSEGGACSAHEQCGNGFYCAFDRTCHPDRHAPMQSIQVLEANVTPQPLPLPVFEEDADASADGSAAEGPPQPFAPHPTGDATVTDYSGSIGSIARTLELPRYTRFLTEIEWREGNDRPCELIARGYHYGADAGEPSQGWPTVRFDCSGFGLLGTSTKTVRTSLTTPIYAIQVCNNGNNAKRRLKAIRVWGARINRDGTTSDANTSDEEVLPNCNDWSPRQTCPNNQVATGVVVLAKEDGSGDRAGITALKLVCRGIKVP